MPKCNLGAKPNNNRLISARIGYMQCLKGISTKELAVHANLTPTTLYDRLRHPEDFRLKELKKICNTLGLNLLELLSEAEKGGTKDEAYIH